CKQERQKTMRRCEIFSFGNIPLSTRTHYLKDDLQSLVWAKCVIGLFYILLSIVARTNKFVRAT
ncbi:MAG: hypothetical protein AAB283_06840, partial [Planctomycetota bacterium]